MPTTSTRAPTSPAWSRRSSTGRPTWSWATAGSDQVEHFSPAKKRLQKFGSWVVRLASNTRDPDATSGFRAISREAALRTFVTSEFTYTLETIIQAGASRLAVEFVPIEVNPKTRASRVMSGDTRLPAELRGHDHPYLHHVPAAARVHRPGHDARAAGHAAGTRFVYLYAIGDRVGHVQSLILAEILIITGFQVLLFGLLADLMHFNRRMQEELRLPHAPPRRSAKGRRGRRQGGAEAPPREDRR